VEEQATWITYSDDHGNPYWWNSVSGESRWTDPARTHTPRTHALYSHK
jgi:hypothetical protein